MPPMPAGAEERILRGLYKLRPSALDQPDLPQAHLFGSGAILNEALRAQEILQTEFAVRAHVWSATSYKELRRDALACERANRLRPGRKPLVSYLEATLAREQGVFVAASDNMKLVPEQIARWVPGGLNVLGTDGFGRSDSRSALRRHFEVDAEFIALAALKALADRGEIPSTTVRKAIKRFQINPEKPDPARS